MTTNKDYQISMQHGMNWAPIIKVVKTTCNLRCSYCFYDGSQSKELEIMDENTLKIVIQRFLQASSSKNIRFIWHGGEPLLAGIPFYRNIVQIQEPFLQKYVIRNSIQTNGTLITSEWAEFFSTNKFGVGVSLDGPEHIHNRIRRNANGHGSFRQVMNGITELRQTGINTGAIAVINNYSVHYPDELFEFFYRNQLSFNANDCVSGVNDPPSVKELAVEPKEYAEFLLKIFDLWLDTGDTSFQIKPLDDFVHAVMRQQPHMCKFTGSCYRYLTIDTNGDVYPCQEYLNSEHNFGNLVSSTLDEIFTSPKFQQYYLGRKQTQTSCSNCKWLPACKGWCMRSWNGETSISELSGHHMCETLQYMFESISKKLNDFGYQAM